MLRALVILVLASVVVCAPASEDANARIIGYQNENDGTGNYHYSFETSNGLTREETGTVVNRGLEDEHIQVSGNYKYFDEAGAAHIVYYTADKDGFHILPEGNVIETQDRYHEEPFVITGLPGPAVATLLG